jgi:hypothetical protein
VSETWRVWPLCQDAMPWRACGSNTAAVACRVEVVLALLRAEEVADFTDGAPERRTLSLNQEDLSERRDSLPKGGDSRCRSRIRLICVSGFDDDRRLISSGKLKYNFSDLTGIIFGIRTSFEDKIKIMRIVEHKCRAESRGDFEFHQARYSHRKRKIELLPLSMLRLSQ